MPSSNPYESPTDELTRSSSKKGLKWIAGLAGILLVFAFFVFVIFLPMTRRARPAANRTYCKNNLKQLGLAMYNYESDFGTFPPAYTVDENGHRLHSWRTLILPYLEEQELYDSIDLSKPWNAPENQTAYQTSLTCFQCPASDVEPTRTTYLGVAIAGGVLSSSEPTSIRDIKDGTSNTLLVIEVDTEDAVHWMCPDDAGESELFDRTEENAAHQGGFQVAFCDGSVRFVSSNIDLSQLRSLLTKDGGEVIGEF